MIEIMRKCPLKLQILIFHTPFPPSSVFYLYVLHALLGNNREKRGFIYLSIRGSEAINQSIKS